MARQTGFITFTGKLGNMVGYCRHGDYFIRTLPEKVRQTPATRKAAYRFGITSTYGRLIRQTILPHLHLPYDGALVNRLNSTLAGLRERTAGLQGFSFNRHAGLQQYLTITPQLTRNGTLHIPPQSLRQVTGITQLRLTLVASRIDFSTRRIGESSTLTHIIDMHTPFAGLTLDSTPPGKGTLILTLQVQAMTAGRIKTHRAATVADVIAVLPPQLSSSHPRVQYPHRQQPRPRISRHLPYLHHNRVPARPPALQINTPLPLIDGS
ncbi:hypothetical protein KTO58_27675 [Chitinophaga pendula]|uniref:hypothetical protein n=1 Tax=Chitinophaga TaxID=79328 RepID=UPI000BB0AC17|nr:MULTISPECIES: hypothetical protein [Chitinophaga]ASZ09664.1 hypothetical protein CK934_01090 [Chitinophaga sp. MD30]UCJ07397.1 hypothetical protein KTO58_27675 [Chitinophaga pendula]